MWLLFLSITFILLYFAKGEEIPDYDFRHRKAGLVLLPSVKFHYNELYDDIMEPKTEASFVDFAGEWPPNTFVGGHDCDHNPYFIGRTVHNRQMVVGRVAIDDVLYIGYEEAEFPKLEFQVLVNGTSAGAKWTQVDKEGIERDVFHPLVGGTWKRRPTQKVFVCRAITEQCNLLPGYAIVIDKELVCVTSTNNKCFRNNQFDVILNFKT